ncbi:hypothetical protein BDN71DRAFT_808761 [Pleurotus eryngii]|uniref:Uncharacterized protein n=1 Tax=Pleurotus eryngii TaxID=5323 RepID=A0A9P6A136_PLEER|nr:hypothetical protein BDN71DRAFT_808761 [Pleurotus eryngii]
MIHAKGKPAVNKVIEDNNGLTEEVGIRGSIFLGSLLPNGKNESGNRPRTILGRHSDMIDEVALISGRPQPHYKGGRFRGIESLTSAHFRHPTLRRPQSI